MRLVAHAMCKLIHWGSSDSELLRAVIIFLSAKMWEQSAGLYYVYNIWEIFTSFLKTVSYYYR